MQARIADEIKRPNISDQIAYAILDAITFYQLERFFFNEATDTSTTTVQGTNIYAGPSDLIELVNLEVTVPASGLIYPLDPRDIEEILLLDQSIPPIQGQPTKFAFFGNQFRLWPTPDLAYQLTFFYQQQIPAPVNDTDQGFWMTTAEPMVRHMAKALLYIGTIHDSVKADAMRKIADTFFQQLKKETAGKLYTGKTHPTSF